jgi:hypothetical protein
MVRDITSKIIKSFLCGVLISIMGCCSVIIANAYASTNGTTIYETVFIHSFSAYNTAITNHDSNCKFAIGCTSIDAEQNLDGGYMFVKPSIYNSNGNLIAAGNIEYSSNNSSGMARSVTYYIYNNTSPSIRAKGIAGMWHEVQENYVVRTVPQTPLINNY